MGPRCHSRSAEWGNGTSQLHRCRRVKQHNECPGYDTKLHLMMSFQPMSLAEYGITLYWHCFHVWLIAMKDTPYSPKLQDWSLTIKWFYALSKTIVEGILISLHTYIWFIPNFQTTGLDLVLCNTLGLICHETLTNQPYRHMFCHIILQKPKLSGRITLFCTNGLTGPLFLS